MHAAPTFRTEMPKLKMSEYKFQLQRPRFAKASI